ncbi:M56 family metallopeptidase [Oscillospiraceae bacterium OttesenSCG-928-F05]|nr:M56 family metallopeptidase [Oscillospiraceae bacterium OttesenSCG-928-F05]
MQQFSLIPFGIIISLSLLRLILSIELPFTRVLHSSGIMPGLNRFFTYELFSSFRVWHVFVLTWGIGTFVYLCRLIVGIYRTSKTVNYLTISNPKLCIAIGAITKELMQKERPSKAYRLIVSPELPMSQISGYLTPIFLIPEYVLADRADEIAHVINHEWQHFKRKDIWLKTVFEVCAALLWWNPLTYILKDDLEQVLEINCDLQVSKHMNRDAKNSYLTTIMKSVLRAKEHQDKIKMFVTSESRCVCSIFCAAVYVLVLIHNPAGHIAFDR